METETGLFQDDVKEQIENILKGFLKEVDGELSFHWKNEKEILEVWVVNEEYDFYLADFKSELPYAELKNLSLDKLVKFRNNELIHCKDFNAWLERVVKE